MNNTTDTSQDEQTSTIKTHQTDCSMNTSEEVEKKLCSSTSSIPSTPILPSADVNLTENEHEDNLMELIDQLIYRFLKRTSRRSPYRTCCRWTCDYDQDLSYSVIIKIQEPSPLNPQ